ncbi:MAG: protein dehydratase [Bdellovibrionales bacterium RIFCSPHIGHO2_01_FULL_40_29]|nr:MAG: protein dehydratase [Bdellovibrionales bacterium RIFCSPHIGHO2_01_FULL_40_29]OFZ35501.1 MAG: protein dehydratase [Bdellovibrionales bacterium RIFCSPHIGHO2_02_FULL_40_15]
MTVENDADRDVGYKAIRKIQITDQMVRQFAEMSGDTNPIHLDEEFAKTTRFKRRIAHGMILGALCSRYLNETIGSGGIYLAQTLKFTNPVFIDDILIFELEITKLHKARGFGTVQTTAKKENGEIVMKGEATIMISWGSRNV